MDAGNLAMHGRFNHERLFSSDVFREHGFFSSVSRGSLWQWVHAGMLEHFGTWKCCPSTPEPVMGAESCCCCRQKDGAAGICPVTKPRRQPRACPKTAPQQSNQSSGGTAAYANHSVWQSKRMCNGALIGFRKDDAAYEMVLKPWVQCAINSKCIIPKGSSRMNHRQDQSALSVLVDRAFGLGRGTAHCSIGPVSQAGVVLHKDESLSADECAELVGRKLPKHKHVWY